MKHAPRNILNLDETSDISDDSHSHGSNHSHNLDGLANGEAPKPKDLKHILSSNIKKKQKTVKKKKIEKKKAEELNK